MTLCQKEEEYTSKYYIYIHTKLNETAKFKPRDIEIPQLESGLKRIETSK